MIKRGFVFILLAVMFAAAAGSWPMVGRKGDGLPKSVVYAAEISTDKGEEPTATQERKVQVLVNGKPIEFEVQPQIMDDRTYVPFRKLLESLGATVTWDEANLTAVAEKDGLAIKIQINTNIITFQDIQLKMDVNSKVKEGRTMIPLRFAAEVLGAAVKWVPGDQADRVEITQNYDTMVKWLVNGTIPSSDTPMDAERALIVMEWLNKGQEKGELPKFVGEKPLLDLPAPEEVTNKSLEFRKTYVDEKILKYGSVPGKLIRDVYASKFRFNVAALFEPGTKDPYVKYVVVADQTSANWSPKKGRFVKAYYPAK